MNEIEDKQLLTADELRKINAYWRAANYLSVGQIYLLDNPLLREPLKLKHTKPRLLGHWGTTPGLNFIYVHLNRLIKQHDLNVIYIAGPGHDGHTHENEKVFTDFGLNCCHSGWERAWNRGPAPALPVRVRRGLL